MADKMRKKLLVRAREESALILGLKNVDLFDAVILCFLFLCQLKKKK